MVTLAPTERDTSGASDGDALLTRVAGGDEESFAALYDLFAGKVYGVVLRVLRDPSQAEEVAQEIFVEMWRIAPRYDVTRGSVGAWILTIAHRRAVDRVRSEQARRDRVDRATRVDPLRGWRTPDPADETERADEHAQVRAALTQLSELQLETIELTYYGGRNGEAVSLSPTIRSPDRSSLRRDRSAEDPRSPLTEGVGAEPPLPRHLLVALTGITADVISLQQRCVETPQLHASLETVLGRLDGLVDSIYERAVAPAPPTLNRSGLAAGALADARADVPVAAAAATNVALPPSGIERSLPGHRPEVRHRLRSRREADMVLGIGLGTLIVIILIVVLVL